MNCLHVEHITKTFQRKSSAGTQTIRAVDDVSFSMESGQSIGIIGTSGCGKTTLLHCILGLISPDSGTVQVQRPIGIVGQDPYASLPAGWTVAKIVAEPLLFLHKARRFSECAERVQAALRYVQLPIEIYGNRLPSQLSGGERQRVSIARALISQPQLLLLDEPTSMLDQEVKQDVAALLQDIAARQNTAFLMVTHDIALACSLCERILVMDQGHILEDRPAADLLRDPHSKLAQELLRIHQDIHAYWQEHYGIVRPRRD